MRRYVRWAILAATIPVLSGVHSRIGLAAEATRLDSELHDAQTQQEHLRTESQHICEQLDSLIAEFRDNGLEGGPDFKTLVAIRSVVGNLTETQMSQVISLLDRASAAKGSQAIHLATDAHTDQSNILGQLQTLLNQYQQQQAIVDLADRFAKLADRQKANLDSVIQSAGEMRYHAPNDPVVRDTLQVLSQVLSSDQATLQADATTALADLASFASHSNAGDQAHKARDLAAKDQLDAVLADSVQSLKGALLYSAAGQEKSAHDILRDISRQLGMPQDEIGRLRQAEKEIDQQIDDQTQVALQSADLDRDKTQKEATESHQADVVASADLTRKDLTSLDPAAATTMQKAEEQMQGARSAINRQDLPAAAKNQQAALDQLQQAKAAVAQQIQQEEAQANQDQDNLSKLQDLKAASQQLKQAQDALNQSSKDADNRAAKQNAADQQAHLEQQAQQLQQKAGDALPQAAQKLAEAASQMDKAQQALAQGDNAKAADPQQAASNALDQVQKQLDQDLAKMQAQAAEEKQLELLRDKLQQIVASQVKAQGDTGAAAAAPDGSAQKLAPAQTKLASDTAAVQQQLPPDSTAAAPPLTDAKTNMDGAAKLLAASDAKSAAQPQTDAVTDLYKALAALNQQIQQLQQALGQQPNTSNAMNNLAQQLNNAQHQLAQAQDGLNQPSTTQPDPQQAAAQLQQMQQAQQQIAQRLQQMVQNAQGADQQQLQHAQNAAQHAAADLGQNNLQQAGQDMQQASNRMQQAQQNQPQQGQQPSQGQQGQQQQNQQGQQQQAQGGQQGQNQQGAQAQGQQANGQLQQIQQQQAQLEQLLGTQVSQQQPAAALNNLAQQMGQMAAASQAANAPADAAQAMQAAQQAMAAAAAQAAAGQNQQAQVAADQAQAAIAQAQAALGMAQSGLGQQAAGQPGQPGQPGQQPGQPGQQLGGQQPDQASAQGQPSDENNPGQSTDDLMNPDKTGVTDTGHANRNLASAGAYTALPARDRQALTQSEREKYPQAYGSLVEGYLSNLSSDDDHK
jgi:hypothetical protein